ncbi:hypothetical protein HRR83_006187 [Exophiala dermatitidis]|uniref:Uncharacterized protein n=2 Tax=Exophiala dermatitidis TaxID=5970 RepID=H6BM98_EXODN|nr:uncharacterized protein HMPREF1120_01180 [Exophiala dermatitidis NIH/UT8656]KAJ4512215.1 hypothetical protein HRR75_005115 [Exophiala dermatitidis]EHY52979.1 hypothetical protein HMPREF1120_01180 [Exophiala dermatitidis NIH/UT8656]KAJ4515118.1 hypothetical protein HRR74_005583 [Exophiala dermatitidis]KAJ4517611.1 hypothetical protein HRR73_004663 [Exophiala dermatitidis]KAJ4548630.1 hypothetical protein HRR76_001220 [Exophiala dermatitidis]
MEGYRNPELQRVLAALNSYAPPPPPAATISEMGTFNAASQQYTPTAGTPHAPVLPGLYLLAQPETQQRPITPPPVHRQQTKPSTLPSQTIRQEEVRSMSSTPTVPDASTITTWPAALKHVTRHLVPNEQAARRIKHLITEQHKHERQWWAGREAIVARQQGRSGTSQQVAELLKSLGGKEVPAAPSDPAANQAELVAYDKKVYAQLKAMAADFDRQLRAIGVPFFAIKHDLVILETGPEKDGSSKGRIDKGELRELQKRMLQTLEDLFSD